MGFTQDAYVSYGFKLPLNPYDYDDNGRPPSEQIDQALKVPTVKEACPDVGHLEAGGYDQNMLFLVTKSYSASLGGYTRIGYDREGRSVAHQEADWDRQLMHTLEVMGWTGLADTFEPGWFVVADVS